MKWLAISFICAFFFFTSTPVFANEAEQDGIRPITWDEMGKLGIDEDNNLYWDDKQVILKKEYSLEWHAQFAAYLGAAGALLAGIGTLLNGIANCRAAGRKKTDN